MKDKMLIYGAGGYMGRLFTRHAKLAGLPFVLGSRDAFETTDPLRIFGLESVGNVGPHLSDVLLVVNLAGPYTSTQSTLIEACLATQTHYIDIAGEAPEFESAYAYRHRALEKGILLMPGAGFGVVPTDLAARAVKDKLPDATRLVIAYVTEGGASRGTLKTVLKDINKAGVEIINGQSVAAMPAQSDFHFSALGKRYRVVYNPWRGDLFTAQLSTQIPNIRTYANFPGFVERMMKGQLLWLRDFILNYGLRFLPVGPSEKDLRRGRTIVYAEAQNDAGQKAQITLIGPEAYLFTAQALTIISSEIAKGNVKMGFQTPAQYREAFMAQWTNVQIIA